ncbi:MULTISPECIES: hypothetical protein [Kitasatospora]|uniref:hypothetical protein n=1 Tax=Kitasatospora TaxID=2063 RepID=UPI0031D50EC3
MTRTRLHPRTAEGSILLGALGLLLAGAVALAAVPAGVRVAVRAARRRGAPGGQRPAR